MKLRSLGGVAIAACLFSLVQPAAPAFAAPLIQPGELSVSGDAGCTLSFVYDGGGGTYVGTAAHCVPDGVGADVALSDGTVFGDVAMIGNESTTATDWALIRVRTAHLGRVSPGVKGHPSVPRGVTTPAETALGDQTIVSGYGVGFDLTAATRERRVGLLTYDDSQIFTTLGASIFGDSGGPVVHKPTGKALGIVSRLCIGTCEMEGPTVQGILSQAAARGLSLSLRTV
jgi:hypothetical protein